MLTQEIVRELLHYNPETGVLTWKERGRHWFQSCASYRRWNSRYSGQVAGSNGMDKNGAPYRKITIMGESYAAHRIIWILVNGSFSKGQIDHRDRNPLNNSWDNIREASSYENMNNRGVQSNNRSGVPGVSWCKIRKKWRARPMCNGVRVDIGYFDDLDLAAMECLEMRIDSGYPPQFAAYSK